MIEEAPEIKNLPKSVQKAIIEEYATTGKLSKELQLALEFSKAPISEKNRMQKLAGIPLNEVKEVETISVKGKDYNRTTDKVIFVGDLTKGQKQFLGSLGDR